MIRLGAQLSPGDGFETAIREAGAAGLRCVQFFSRSPVGGQSRALPKAGALRPVMDQAGVEIIFVHAPYFVNPASADPEKHDRAASVLKNEMRRAKRLSAAYVVMHPGHQGPKCPRERALDACVQTVHAMLSAPGRVLIENVAGQGREIGGDLEELGSIFARIGKTRRVGLMLDTAHAMAFGHPLVSADDVEQLMSLVHETIGLDRVGALHLNDSGYPVGSRRDRHARLLEGPLGKSALNALVHWADRRAWPMVLETPGRDVAARQPDYSVLDGVGAALHAR